MQVRTSFGNFLSRYYDPVLAGVQERVAEWLGVPVPFQEDMQVLRYGLGQEYKAHLDGHDRMATVLIYLSGMPRQCLNFFWLAFDVSLLGCDVVDGHSVQFEVISWCCGTGGAKSTIPNWMALTAWQQFRFIFQVAPLTL
jgi:hypothetical protein